MRTGLIVFGVIFIVFGGILYFMPTQTAGATTTTIDEGGSDTRVSYASVHVPLPVSLGIAAVGLILFFLGLIVPDTKIIKKEPEYTHVVETSETVEEDDGKKQKVVKERREEKKR